MKLVIAAVIVLSCTVAAYKAHKIAAHNAYVKGCSSIAEAFLGMLGVPATASQIADTCSNAATQEGY